MRRRFSSGSWRSRFRKFRSPGCSGRNLSCKEIGGDFFDAVNTDEGLAVVLADVSGKGVSAARAGFHAAGDGVLAPDCRAWN